MRLCIREGMALLLVLVLGFFSCGKRGEMAKNDTGETGKRVVAEVIIKGNRLWAEVVDTPEKQAQGLMFRPVLAPDSGMLFVFERDDTLRFWMKNTYIPLAIAFIDANRVITDILEMIPLDTQTIYASSKPVRYALEVNSGWFFSHRIGVGDTVSWR